LKENKGASKMIDTASLPLRGEKEATLTQKTADKGKRELSSEWDEMKNSY